MIEVRDLHTYRGINYVLQGVSLTIQDGCCTVLLGRNGMGKTTLVHTIMGLLRPRSGGITLGTENLVGRPPFQIAQRGIALIPQGRRIFPSLTVEENLTLGARDGGWTLDRVYDLFGNLKDRRRNRGGQLSGGEQQMLAIGRALLTNPSLLLMDEPSEGLAPVIVEQIGGIIASLRRDGLSIFLVEQNYGLAIDSADLIYILSNGRVVWQGTASELDRHGPGAGDAPGHLTAGTHQEGQPWRRRSTPRTAGISTGRTTWTCCRCATECRSRCSTPTPSWA